MRRRKRKRLRSRSQAPSPATQPNECWALDFMSDHLADGRSIRALTVIDIHTRECLAVELDTSISGERVTRVLDRLISWRGEPVRLLSDNGPEFTIKALAIWCYRHSLDHHFIEPGKPSQNGHLERFNMKATIKLAQGKITFPTPESTVQQGGMTFLQQDAIQDLGDTKAKQTYYMGTLKGYSLTVLLVYKDEVDGQVLKQTVGTLRFRQGKIK